MRIDAYLPVFDVRDSHEALVDAEQGPAYEALRSFDLGRSRLVRLLFAVRTLPSLGRPREPRRPSGPFLEQALRLGWALLEEVRGSELVMGAVTRPWAPVVRFRGLPGPQFVAFDEPGFSKIVWNFAARPAGPRRTVLSIETRVAATDDRSRRRFRLYWFVFGPGIRLIRRAALGVLRRDLARSARGEAPSVPL